MATIVNYYSNPELKERARKLVELWKTEKMTKEQEKRMLKHTKGDLYDTARFCDICEAVRENVIGLNHGFPDWMSALDQDIACRASDICERHIISIYDSVLWMYDSYYPESV